MDRRDATPSRSPRGCTRSARGRGVTLVESLLTIIVLGFSAFNAIVIVTHDMRGVRNNQRGLLAKAAASREMERRINWPFANIGVGTFPFSTTEDGVNPIANATGQIFVCANYNPATGVCDAAGNAGMKQVTVTVTLDGSRAFRLVSVVTDWSLP